VTLVRNVPAAVKGLKGGFNEVTSGGVKKKVAEFLWQANEERNVIGYRVYRPGAKRPEEAGLACPSSLAALSTATSCVDFSPPEPKAANLTYTVTALYRNAENSIVEGTPATITLVAGPPPAPNPPTELKLKKNATTGAVELEWKAPTSGETPIFYRIYRGSSEYSGRYDVTAGTETKYIDGSAVEPHRYWVTAVDSNLTESSPLGWVEG
jgi:fibronectin type 3 domain-containing protein